MNDKIDPRFIRQAEELLPCPNVALCGSYGNFTFPECAVCVLRPAVAQALQDAFEAGQRSANQVCYEQNAGPVTKM